MHSSPTLVCHKALRDDHAFPPNSLEAVRACLAAEADIIEIDVVALAKDDYLLVHDATLESETTGHGPTGACTLDHARSLRIRHDGHDTGYAVPVLSDVIATFAAHGGEARLQIDFKDVVPFPAREPLERLARIIAPLGERVSVSSGADWQLRQMRRTAPRLELGLEIQLHLDWDPSPMRPAHIPPYRRGAYDYHDDSLIAARPIWPAADYLWDRCQALIALVPGARTFYINHQLLAQSLEDGFSWAEPLHAAGIRLDAWTMDVTNATAMANLPRLLDAGVDQITSNTPVALKRAIEGLADRS